MSYHSCKTGEPEKPKIGDVYTCMCGITWRLVRRFPWKKWERVKEATPS